MEDAVATGVSLFTVWGVRVLSAVLIDDRVDDARYALAYLDKGLLIVQR